MERATIRSEGPTHRSFSPKSLEEKARELQALLKDEPRNTSLYIKLANLRIRNARLEDAAALLQAGLAKCDPDEELYREAAYTLQEANRTEDALTVLRRAATLFPAVLHFRLWEALLLPVLYETEEQAKSYRTRYAEGLKRLKDEIKLSTPEDSRAALDAVRRQLNFYLGYQGEDDRVLQEQYGEFLHQVVAANYPRWTARRMPAVSAEGKIRIGYISAHFREHSVAKLFLGWLEERNRKDFEIFVYHNGSGVDRFTERVRNQADHFRHIPGKFEEMCEAIVADDLHIAVYLDVRHRRLSMMSSLRLAPIQCVTWAYPITSGSPMLDYYLSSDLMEPENGQEHYCEEMIRLPGIGVCYPKPVIPKPLLVKVRKDFGIGDDKAVFLCCQTTFKYLPQHDDIFVRIAKRVPDCQFVFLGLNEPVARDFRLRLERVFGDAGLDAADLCVILPQLSTLDYWNLNLLSDVFLDTLGWSGGVTALEAIACGLPVVTLPGQFMRARHSYGILKQLGVTETIASNKEQYVEIAARLAHDSQWRYGIVQQMKANEPRLFSDTKCVRALEEFYRSVVKNHSSRG